VIVVFHHALSNADEEDVVRNDKLWSDDQVVQEEGEQPDETITEREVSKIYEKTCKFL
jgi:hypothetical protein